VTRTCSCSGMFADVELRQVCSSRSVTYGLVIRSSCALRTSVLLTFFYFYNVRFTGFRRGRECFVPSTL
jgi:hypothetical protein